MSAVLKEDPRSIAELIADQKAGYSLQQRFYTDPDIYELELERVIYRNWIFAGHESQLPAPGDFRVLNVAGESAIIVRGKDGVLKGFANVCRHRGSLVCLEEKGHVDKFACPYHGWMYDIDGKLFAARDMPEDFDMAAHSLKTVSVGLVHGLIFVCFTDDPLSLDGCREDLAEAGDVRFSEPQGSGAEDLRHSRKLETLDRELPGVLPLRYCASRIRPHAYTDAGQRKAGSCSKTHA